MMHHPGRLCRGNAEACLKAPSSFRGDAKRRAWNPYSRWWSWIPGSRQAASPGMTTERYRRSGQRGQIHRAADLPVDALDQRLDQRTHGRQHCGNDAGLFAAFDERPVQHVHVMLVNEDTGRSRREHESKDPQKFHCEPPSPFMLCPPSTAKILRFASARPAHSNDRVSDLLTRRGRGGIVPLDFMFLFCSYAALALRGAPDGQQAEQDPQGNERVARRDAARRRGDARPGQSRSGLHGDRAWPDGDARQDAPDGRRVDAARRHGQSADGRGAAERAARAVDAVADPALARAAAAKGVREAPRRRAGVSDTIPGRCARSRAHSETARTHEKKDRGPGRARVFKKHTSPPRAAPARPRRWRRGPIVATLAVARLRRASGANISPGPYRSFRELSLAGSVDPDIWCPPTFVGNSGIERFNGVCGFALLSSSYPAKAGYPVRR